MSEVPWKMVRPILEQVLELDGPERDTCIEALCGENAALATEVRRLVALDEQEQGSDAAAKLADISFGDFLGLPKALGQGDAHGGFHIERELGAGGMGRVYLARQAQPHREVALKVMRPDFATDGYMARFRREQSILANLHHPGIAQIFEAGLWTDERGDVWPFFAMEYVPGARTLTDHCDHVKLTRDEKIQLFHDVCDAVQEAHSRGVVHRDLKPGNVLVDEDGKPKVIDFGVAQAADSGLDGADALTHTGEMVGTVRFMSPEQVDGSAVDARSDVYSLGVVLYELLCGRPPYGEITDEFAPLALAISQTDPVRPSLIEPGLRGDLEWVLLRCLEKDAARRYADAGELRDDLAAFMQRRPVLASPPSLTYRIRRFVSRNRLPVALAALFSTGLAATGVISAQLFLEAREEQLQRELEARNAESARESLLSAITQLSPRRAERVRVDKMLEQASRDASVVFKDDREGQITARASLVYSMVCIGMIDEAVAEAKRCLSLIGDEADASDIRVAQLRYYLAQGAYNQGRPREALEQAQATLQEATKLGGPECPGAIHARAELGNLLVLTRADVPAGQQLLMKARSSLLARKRPNDALLLRVEEKLAICWTLTDRADEGLQLIQSVIERSAADGGAASPTVIMLRLKEASALASLGRVEAAAAAAQTSLAGIEAELPSDHPLRLFTLAAASFYIAGAGDYERALQMLEPNLPLLAKIWGPEHPETLKAEDVMADALEWTGRPEDSLRSRRKVLERARKAMGANAVQLVPYLYRIAAALERAGRLPEAMTYYEEVLPLTQKAYGLSHSNVLGLQLKVAAHYVDQSRLADARQLLAQLQQQRDGGAAELLGDLWMLQGKILIAEERRDDAREPLRRALEWFTAKGGAASASATAAAAALRSCKGDGHR